MATLIQSIKRYSVPIVLFSLGLYFQLFVLPQSYPPSHYTVLGVNELASVEEITKAYDHLSSKWYSGLETSMSMEFIKVRYAYELLTNPLWKRDYDLFGIDEQVHVIQEVRGQYDGVDLLKTGLSLLDASSSDLTNRAFNVLSSEKFLSLTGEAKSMLIQVYSEGSPRCAKFIRSWRKIANLLDGVADTGMVELGDVQLASYLAERKPTKQPFFRNGLPAIVAFPPNCKSSSCYIRYQGDLSVDAIVDWMVTDVIGLPRIPYHTKETLVPNFFAKSGQHKVKVILISKTGERAAPFLRQAAQDYWAYASFATILWREEDAPLWYWNMFHVESAPAIVFVKDPGVKPVVYYGSVNSTEFSKMMENNKHQELPQLRSLTSMELGCDAKGFSRAGNDTVTWYCVIVVGRPSLELNNMRQTIRRARSILRGDLDSDIASKDNFSVSAPAAVAALKEDRLTFAWLDGEAQKKYCLYYIHVENVHETCGPRGYVPDDVPQLIIIRYKRNSTENELMANKATKKIIWDLAEEVDVNAASQLVSRYNGSQNMEEIIKWISQIVEDGDTRELPYFVGNTPELIPEDANPIWSKSVQGVLSARKGIKQRVQSIIANINDYMKDPRIGPILLLVACLSFGTIWLQSNQPTQPARTDEGATRRRGRRAERPPTTYIFNERPSSVTDAEPKDAHQILQSDSDSD